MFGMLDYRAHKLFWLVGLPFTIIAKLSFYGVVLASILIAEHTSYSVPTKILIAYLAMEAIAILVFDVFWRLVFWSIRKVFFFIVDDVIPSCGANADEAAAVALIGKECFLLNKKLENEIECWTDEDTRGFVSQMNWRARLFFGDKIRERFTHSVAELKRIHQETGNEPRDIQGIERIREGVKGGHVTILEKVIVNQRFFNSIMALIIILFAFSTKVLK